MKSISKKKGTRRSPCLEKNSFKDAPNTFVCVDVSTAHISREDNTLLNLASTGCADKRNFLIVHGHEFGYFVHAQELDLDDQRVLYVAGYSKEFISLVCKVAKLGARYLYLDGDGITYSDLPSFEW